ncbi:MAG: SGNH/GDSL hydrolase family protein [Acidobacteriaceae bacterium]
MNEYSFFYRMQHPTALLGCAALLLAFGCSNSSTPAPKTVINSGAKNQGNYSSTVFLGDSLTAGFQSGSLLDTAQVHGWAPLVATQASFKITQPLIAPPGAPPVLILTSFGPPPVIQPMSGQTKGRDNPSIQPTDLAVPGAEVNDVLNTVPLVVPTTGQEIMTQLVLGYPGLATGFASSQATYAAQANPTTIFLWIGNNDALVADETGMPSSMTSVTDFTTQYKQLLVYLTNNTKAHLVIANIPDVTLVPYLTPAALILGEYSAATGMPASTLSAVLGIVPGDKVNPTGLGEIPLILGGKQKGPIDDAGVLSAAEIATVQAQVQAYNQVIAAQATAAGATLVDINALFAQVAANGITVNGYPATFSYLNGVFSLDGIHPTNTGYALLANKFIDTMNAANSSTIADVSLSAVAATDPLFPPNLKVGAVAVKRARISAAAGQYVEKTLLPSRLTMGQK